KVTAFLHLAPPVLNTEGNQAGMDGEKSTHRGVSSPKFLAQQRVAYVVHARTAIHRIDWSRQEAELSHAPDQVQGKFAFLVGFARDGGDLLLGKYASLG